MIYLDNAATTKIHPEVLEAMMPYLTDEYGNAGTIYGLGRRAATAIDTARQQVASFIGCDPEQVIFTSSGSEANSLAIQGLKHYLLQENKRHIITSSTEHDSVIKAIENMCIKDKFDATFLKVGNQGKVSVKELEEKITPRTGLVSIMYMNNEIGSINPIQDIVDICKRKNILLHTDCVQAAGCCSISAKEMGCDLLSVSSHKVHGPKGVGALYVKDVGMLSPIIHGGTTQELGVRGGTANVAGIVGFGKACELMLNELNIIDIHTSILKQTFYESLTRSLSDLGMESIVHINGDLIIKHGKILNLRFDEIDAETLVLLLDAKGVCVSAGSACRSSESVPSRVLMAIGLNEDESRSSIRVSFSNMNTKEEVVVAGKIIAESVGELLRCV